MAKKSGRGRRRASRYHPVTILENLALGALAAQDVIAGQLTADVATEAYWANSAHVTVVCEGLAATEGPLDVWIGSSGLTAAQVEAFLETSTSFAMQDISAKEIQSRGRYVKHVGTLTDKDDSLNEGRTMKVKLGFKIATGQSLTVFVRNQQSAVLTTGTFVLVQGTLHGNWI